MTSKRFFLNDDGRLKLVAFKGQNAKPIVFHPENLLVGELSSTAWDALSARPTPLDLGLAKSKTVVGAAEAANALAELVEWSELKSDEVIEEESSRYISSINLNVTQICNLKCVYCEAGGDGSYGRPEKRMQIEKNIPMLGKLLDRVPNQEVFVITFVGGEPMLYPEGMQAVIDFAREHSKSRGVQLKFRVVTNGTLINENSIKTLISGKLDLVVSVNGPAEIQDRVSPTAGGKPSALAVEKGLALLQKHRVELGKITLRAVFGTYNTDVRKTYDYLSAWDFDSMELNYDVTSSDVKASEDFTAKMTELAWDVFNKKGEDGLRKIRLFDHVFDRLDTKLRVMNFCDSGKSFAVVDSSGNLFKCPWEVNNFELRTGTDITDESLSLLQDIEISLIEHNNCGQCWARHLCGGGCMYAHGLATGSKQKPDPIYCKRTRALISEAILVYTLSREGSSEQELSN